MITVVMGNKMILDELAALPVDWVTQRIAELEQRQAAALERANALWNAYNGQLDPPAGLDAAQAELDQIRGTLELYSMARPGGAS